MSIYDVILAVFLIIICFAHLHSHFKMREWKNSTSKDYTDLRMTVDDVLSQLSLTMAQREKLEKSSYAALERNVLEPDSHVLSLPAIEEIRDLLGRLMLDQQIEVPLSGGLITKRLPVAVVLDRLISHLQMDVQLAEHPDPDVRIIGTPPPPTHATTAASAG